MATFHRHNYSIAQFRRWFKNDQLVLQPKFQRRPAWRDDARSYLVDTIVRGLPVPKVYLRRKVNPKTQLMAYEVVDGQQRLKAILDFSDNKLLLRKRHNPELGDVAFQGLDQALRAQFLEYEISTEVMENASDPEVWAMFERLNTYTLALNKQEKLNARYFGYFKQTAYRLAAEQSALDAWKALGVFGDRQISRMKEVELTSDVLVAIIRGISDITSIAKAYKDFDEEFPNQRAASDTFEQAHSYITRELTDAVRTTRFRSKAWFYSFMVAAADAITGIPGGMGPAKPRPGSEVRKRLFSLDQALKLFDLDETLRPQEPLRGLRELHEALSRGTSHVPERKVRHAHFLPALTLTENAWSKRWAEFT